VKLARPVPGSELASITRTEPPAAIGVDDGRCGSGVQSDRERSEQILSEPLVVSFCGQGRLVSGNLGRTRLRLGSGRGRPSLD